MQRPSVIFREFVESDDGVTAIEYALLAGLIAVVIVLAVASVGAGVNSLFTRVSDQVTAVTSGI
jgi:pilus assembly protein Flp/PilA